MKKRKDHFRAWFIENVLAGKNKDQFKSGWKAYLKELSQNGAAPKTQSLRPDDQISLSDVGSDEVRRTLLKPDINSLSPIEALNLLYELQQKAKG